MDPYRFDQPDPATERRDRIAAPLGVLVAAALATCFAAMQPLDASPEPPIPEPTPVSAPAEAARIDHSVLAEAAAEPDRPGLSIGQATP